MTTTISPRLADGLTFGPGDVLYIHPDVAGRHGFRLLVETRRYNDAADVVAEGVQLHDDGSPGRPRTAVLHSPTQYDPVAMSAATEAVADTLTAASIISLGEQPHTKWYQMAPWYRLHWIKPGMVLACRTNRLGVVAVLPEGRFRSEQAARAHVEANLTAGTEGWVLTSDGATRR